MFDMDLFLVYFVMIAGIDIPPYINIKGHNQLRVSNRSNQNQSTIFLFHAFYLLTPLFQPHMMFYKHLNGVCGVLGGLADPRITLDAPH